MTYQFKQRRPTQACLPPKSHRRLSVYARSHRSFRIIALLVALLVSGCATTTTPSTVSGGARDVPELMPGMPVGYLDDQARQADSLRLLPPPPAPGSAGMTFDEEVRANAAGMRGSLRWKQATLDANLNPGHVAKAFECALGTAITQQKTPRLYQMMQRVMVDSGYSTVGGKKKYQLLRPFVVHNDATCTPEDDADLRPSGSYPSGHAAIGWTEALVLAQVAPDQADNLIARGRSLGESRVVCNAHWMSDVVAARVMGAATVARLQSAPEFTEDVAIARKEVARARAAGTRPTVDCKAEAAALSDTLKDAL